MVKEELLGLATEAGFDCIDWTNVYSPLVAGHVTEELDRFANLLIEEICTEIVKVGYWKSEFSEPKQLSPAELTAAIRYRFGLTS